VKENSLVISRKLGILYLHPIDWIGGVKMF
jgi:hypothetical protein